MAKWQCPDQWTEWLAAGLDLRNRWRLPFVMMGLLFARGRRTVSSWLRAAGIRDDDQDYYYFIGMVGRKTKELAGRVVAREQSSPRTHRPQRISVGRHRTPAVTRRSANSEAIGR